MNQRIQKQNIREKYWRYSLYVILLGLGTVIFVELIPFLGGLLGALTIYVLLRGQMRALTIRHKLRRSLAASLLIGEAIVCFLIPLSLLVWLLVAKLQDVTLDPSTVIQPIRNLAELIRERIGYNLLDGDNIAKLVELLPRAVGIAEHRQLCGQCGGAAVRSLFYVDRRSGDGELSTQVHPF